MALAEQFPEQITAGGSDQMGAQRLSQDCEVSGATAQVDAPCAGWHAGLCARCQRTAASPSATPTRRT